MLRVLGRFDMFKRILIPTDFSENCQRVLETAVALADPPDGKMTVRWR